MKENKFFAAVFKGIVECASEEEATATTTWAFSDAQKLELLRKQNAEKFKFCAFFWHWPGREIAILSGEAEAIHCAICGATNKVLFTGTYGPTCEDCME